MRTDEQLSKGLGKVERLAIMITVASAAAFLTMAFFRPPKPEEACQVRLKELGRAVLLYAESNDTFVPPYLTETVGSEDNKQTITANPEAWVGALAPLVKDKEAFFCPSAKLMKGKIEDDPRWQWTTYCTTGLIEKPENFGPVGTFRMSLANVASPNVSYAQDLLVPDTENLQPEDMISPHGSKMTVLFYDGSVRYISIQGE